jgi:hypothetical protein
MQFNGVFTQVTRTPKSGWNEEKYLECAFAFYLEEMKEKFNFHSCWLLVKDQPKWSIGEGSIRKLISGPSENVDSVTKLTSNV